MSAQPTETTATHVCALETRFGSPKSENLSVFTKFISELTMMSAKAAGFWGGELLAPGANGSTWTLIQRFETVEQAQEWLNSSERRKFLEQLPTVLAGESIPISDELNSGTLTEVSTSIVTYVKPDATDLFFDWEAKIIAAQAKRSGYRSLQLQTPPPSQPHQWTSMVRFDSPASLEGWFSSEDRRLLIAEADALVHKSELRRVPSVFPGWVPLDEKGNAPKLWKTALLVLLGLFPVVMLQQIFLSPFLHGLHPVIKTFVSLVGSVAATSFLTMPYFVVSFKWWLFPKKEDHLASLKGALILTALFLASIGIFIQFGGFKP
ncbi:MAG: hypothetical protein K2X77_00440 [Candidatus Obscuribacterales bacterium]|jgi:antibiotic biosynthesis monooxygenase (ABM) superfamily enzyme|nr:hypothetical protein [Candidatus Obscuribacterales bacterium]